MNSSLPKNSPAQAKPLVSLPVATISTNPFLLTAVDKKNHRLMAMIFFVLGMVIMFKLMHS